MIVFLVVLFVLPNATLTAEEPKAKPQKLRVVATVVDELTEKPIDEFMVIMASTFDRPHPIGWQTQTRRKCKDGLFKWEEDRAWDRTLLRFEAKGYRPQVSRAIRDDETGVQLEIRLAPSKGIRGKVLSSDGKPAAGAQVAICTWTKEIYVENGRLRYAGHVRDFAEMATTGKEGTFQLPEELDPWVLVVAHESGFAEPKAEEFERSSEIKLKPWAKVEGEYVVNGKPIVGQSINIGCGRGDVNVNLHYHDDVVTDAAGKFTVERVAPVGFLYAQPFFKTSEHSSMSLWSCHVKIESGKTTKFSMPLIGQAVVGRIKAAPNDRLRLADFTFDVSLRLRPPRAFNFGPGAGGNAYGGFMTSDAGKMFQRTGIPVDADGKFRVEGLPETEYALSVRAMQKPETVAAGARPFDGFYGRRLTVPPQGEAGEIVDLGEIILQWKERPAEKTDAPAQE